MSKKHIFLLLLAAIGFLLIFSVSTTPLLGYLAYGDSDIFQIVGMLWEKYGIIPYQGVWDHKGPVIHLVNAVGYMLTGNRFGVFIIQVVSLWITLIFAYRSFLLQFNARNTLILTGFFLCAIVLPYERGSNNVEEYCLPFLMASCYYIMRWSSAAANGEYRHNYKYAFAYGCCLGVCLMTRTTNMLGICGAITVIFFILLVKKEWKNVIDNILAGLIGISVVTVPFGIYFALKGAFQDFLYGTFVFNFLYAGKAAIEWETLSFYDIIKLFISYFNFIGLALIGLSELIFGKKENKNIGIVWIAMGIFVGVWLNKSYGFLHYGLLLVPYFVIIVIELKRISTLVRLPGAIYLKKIIVAYIIFVVLGASIESKYIYVNYYQHVITGKEDIYVLQKRDLSTMINLANRVPDDEMDSFVAYNCYPGLYIAENIVPDCKYFALQDWQSLHSEVLLQQIRNDFIACSPKWVLVYECYEPVGIQDILNDQYMCVDSQVISSTLLECKLYCHK